MRFALAAPQGVARAGRLAAVGLASWCGERTRPSRSHPRTDRPRLGVAVEPGAPGRTVDRVRSRHRHDTQPVTQPVAATVPVQRVRGCGHRERMAGRCTARRHRSTTGAGGTTGSASRRAPHRHPPGCGARGRRHQLAGVARPRPLQRWDRDRLDRVRRGLGRGWVAVLGGVLLAVAGVLVAADKGRVGRVLATLTGLGLMIFSVLEWGLGLRMVRSGPGPGLWMLFGVGMIVVVAVGILSPDPTEPQPEV